jgi:predicted AAA+ superfamily ATPase
MLKLKPKFLKENGEAKFVVLTMKDYAEIREALEDAEDLRILEESKRRNTGKPSYTLDEVKRRLGIVTRAPKAVTRKTGSRRQRKAS